MQTQPHTSKLYDAKGRKITIYPGHYPKIV